MSGQPIAASIGKRLSGPLSPLFKSSFKIALSLTLAIGISLALDWQKAFWAGLAVIMCSLATQGESLNKGVMRLTGTFIAIGVAIVLVGAFNQHRWLFILFLSLYVAFCAYMAGGTLRGYIWQAAGFSVPLLALPGGGQSVQTFEIFLLRAQETTLGVVIFTLVGLFVWPENARDPFQSACLGGVSKLRRIAAGYFIEMSGKPENAAESVTTIAAAAENINALPGLLNGAQFDSLEVFDQRHAWRQLVQGLNSLHRILGRWHQSLAEVQHLQLTALLPDLAEFSAGVDRRFENINALLSGDVADPLPDPVTIALENNRAAALSHFERAALMSCVEQMTRFSQQLDLVLTAAVRLQGDDDGAMSTGAEAAGRTPRVVDPDRLENSIRMIATVWLAALVWFYVPGVPLGSVLVIMCISLGIALPSFPGLQLLKLLRPLMQALFLATLIYFLVMPQLSGFMQLGLLIFLTAFLICYYYPLPQGFIPRMLSLVLLLLICSFNNQQSYSFIAAAQWYVAFPGILLVLGVASYFPVSNQPQPKLRRALKRYFSSCAFVIGSQGNASEGWISAYKLALHRSELEGLPVKLRSTAATLSADVFAENDQQTLNALLMVPSVLSTRLLELNIALQTPLNIPDRALDREIKEWLGALESRFRALADQSIVSDPRADREQLVTKLARVEAHVAAVMNEDSRTVRLEDNDAMALYRLLGAMRDVSENYLEIATLSETVDWSRLWETRF